MSKVLEATKIEPEFTINTEGRYISIVDEKYNINIRILLPTKSMFLNINVSTLDFDDMRLNAVFNENMNVRALGIESDLDD